MGAPFTMDGFLAFGVVGVCLFIGVGVRAKIKIFQRFLVPACLIGGLVGMIFMNVKAIPLSVEFFQSIAYHFFILSFISIGLTRGEPRVKGDPRGKRIAQGSVWMGLVNGALMASQALIGCLLMLLLGLFGSKHPLQLGLFLPVGFAQGPGQALAVGKSWEATGFTNAVTLGLAFAAIGFFAAMLIGIPLINRGIRKGIGNTGMTEIPDSFRRGFYRNDEKSDCVGEMTTHAGNIDSVAFQAAAVGIVYLLTYLVYLGISKIVGELNSAYWGFFFFFAMLVGMLFRFVLGKLGAGHLLNRGTQTRITSSCVDILVSATLISVELAVVWDYIIPLVLIAAVGALWTTCFVLYFGRRVPELGFERMIAQFGANTGTLSTGLVLLRVVDPSFKTTVPVETGLYSIVAAPFVLGSMLIIMFAFEWSIPLYVQMLIFFAMFIVAIVLLRALKLWRKKMW